MSTFEWNAVTVDAAVLPITPYVAPARSHVLAWEGAPDGRIYVAGDALLLTQSAVAVVGSRKATPSGLRLAADVADAIVAGGEVVVSGLAAGIDAAAHCAAIMRGGRTIAIIGTPLDRAYPRANTRLQEHIYREQLLVSPFAPGTPTRRWHFPARNRLMARLARATVLVEATVLSGTVHQVRACLELGRPVFVAEPTAERVAWLGELVEAGDARSFRDTAQLRALLLA